MIQISSIVAKTGGGMILNKPVYVSSNIFNINVVI